MRNRGVWVLGYASTAAIAGAGFLACGGELAFKTSVAGSAPVSSDPGQFCSDVVSYLAMLEPSIVPLVCEYAVAEVPASQCAEEYSVCTAAAGAAIDAGGGAMVIMTTSGCEASIAKCDATVAQVSQCVSDFGDALKAAAAGLTPALACAQSGDPAKNLAEPASCTSLPSGCLFGSSSVSVSSCSSTQPTCGSSSSFPGPDGGDTIGPSPGDSGFLQFDASEPFDAISAEDVTGSIDAGSPDAK